MSISLQISIRKDIFYCLPDIFCMNRLHASRIGNVFLYSALFTVARTLILPTTSSVWCLPVCLSVCILSVTAAILSVFLSVALFAICWLSRLLQFCLPVSVRPSVCLSFSAPVESGAFVMFLELLSRRECSLFSLFVMFFVSIRECSVWRLGWTWEGHWRERRNCLAPTPKDHSKRRK